MTITATEVIQRTILREVRVGKVARLGKSDIMSGIAKSVCAGSVLIAEELIAGDEYGSPHLHGGAEQVILQYPEEHYAAWQEEFPESAERLRAGGFGENFVACGFNESNICIGDIVEVGEARLQVSMPRQPCFRLNHRFEQPTMARRVQQTGRTGWYYRVLKPGVVGSGDTLRIVERPYPEWTISRIQQFLYVDTGNVEAMATLAELDLMAPLIRDLFRKRLQSLEIEDWSSRLVEGPSDPVPTLAAVATSGGKEWLSLRVKSMTEESPDVRSFTLVAKDGGRLPPSEPGAHIKLKLPNGLERHYSLCENSQGHSYKIAVGLAKESRGGSRWIHESLRLGTTLLASVPSNSFPVAPNAQLHVMFAGGIGITPFLSMIQHFRETGARFRLFYLARSEQTAPFLDELGNLRASEVRFHFTNGDSTRRLDIGAIMNALDETAHVYCCGSALLMDAVRHAPAKLPASNYHFEAFAPIANADHARPFTVQLASSGKSFAVSARHSILEVLRDNAIDVPSSCESGSCGTCVVTYSQGEVDHHDVCLTAGARKSQLAVCVSRAVTDSITLEL
ncbi:MOSC domain-containing protein [Paraburkholderia fungorum]|uniref:MOSC domain-containing protein n=1 Tax=Paraburkholderia fungorum TaxID=134537 RepID=UPI0038BD25D1